MKHRKLVKKLNARLKDYEDMCKKPGFDPRGYRKPGSNK